MREANTVVLPLADYEAMKAEIDRLRQFVSTNDGFITITIRQHAGHIGLSGLYPAEYPYTFTEYKTKDQVILDLATKLTNAELKAKMADEALAESKYRIEILSKKWWQVWK